MNIIVTGCLLRPVTVGKPSFILYRESNGTFVSRKTGTVIRVTVNEEDCVVFETADTVYELHPDNPCLNAETGRRVRLISMIDPYPGKLCHGSEGTITGIDDIGQIHVNWDCGSTLALEPGFDRFEVI